MSWTTEQIAAMVEPDRAPSQSLYRPEIFDLEMERIFEKHVGLYRA
jgi:hypothetical protein